MLVLCLLLSQPRTMPFLFKKKKSCFTSDISIVILNNSTIFVGGLSPVHFLFNFWKRKMRWLEGRKWCMREVLLTVSEVHRLRSKISRLLEPIEGRRMFEAQQVISSTASGVWYSQLLWLHGFKCNSIHEQKEDEVVENFYFQGRTPSLVKL